MAAGDITSTVTEMASAAAIKTYLDSQSTGAATAGADTTSFIIVPDPTRDKRFWVVKIARAAA